jgi:hypothetical protein
MDRSQVLADENLWDVWMVKLTCQTPTGRGIKNGEKFITFYH